MFGWLVRLFRRKPPEPKEPITEEQIRSRAIWSVQMVVLSKRYVDPLDQYSVHDAKAAAMAYFVEDCPYGLRTKDLVKAKKEIDQLEMFILQGKFIV